MDHRNFLITNVIWPTERRAAGGRGRIEFALYRQTRGGMRQNEDYDGWHLAFGCTAGESAITDPALCDAEGNPREDRDAFTPVLLAEAAKWLDDICQEDRGAVLRKAAGTLQAG